MKIHKLLIGPFSIHIIKDKLNSESYKLPLATEAFINNELLDVEEPDFTYIISSDELPIINKDEFLDSYNEGPMAYQISRLDQDSYLWIRYDNRNKVKLAYIISEGWSKWRLIANNSISYNYDSFAELVYIFAYSILRKGSLMLHGVVMEWAGMGIIVSAHSGVGKSTHTNMWEAKEKAKIINGDKALCYKENEIWYSCGAPWCGSSGKYINKSVPIRAIVLLERADKNHVKQISPLQAAMSLIELTYAPSWSEELMTCALDIIDDITQSVSVYKLYCRPDYEAVDILKQELQNTFELVK